jgi:hypothetical protein
VSVRDVRKVSLDAKKRLSQMWSDTYFNEQLYHVCLRPWSFSESIGTSEYCYWPGFVDSWTVSLRWTIFASLPEERHAVSKRKTRSNCAVESRGFFIIALPVCLFLDYYNVWDFLCEY